MVMKMWLGLAERLKLFMYALHVICFVLKAFTAALTYSSKADCPHNRPLASDGWSHVLSVLKANKTVQLLLWK